MSSSQQRPHTPSPTGFESKLADDGSSPTAAPLASSPVSCPYLHISHSCHQLLHMAPLPPLLGRLKPKVLCPRAPPSPHEVIAGLIASRRSSTAASWPTAPERAPAPFWLAFHIVQGPISCPANQAEVAPPPDLKSVSHFSISSYPRVIMIDSFLSSISSLDL